MTGRRRRRGLILVALGIGGFALGLAVAGRGPGRASAPRLVRLGRDLGLRTGTDRAATLGDFAGEAATVLVFTGNDCPNSNKAIPRLVELAARYAPRGVAFLGVNSNASQSAAAIAAHAREHGVSFPVCKDPDNLVADRAGVERTCAVVVLDPAGVIRYHGAIDDRFGRGTVRPGRVRDYLADALDAILAGRQVEVAATPVAGCPIERVRSPAPPRVRPAAAAIIAALEDQERGEDPIEVGPVDYARDVAPIVQRRCQACHRPGQEAPFSLLTFEDARTRAAGIAEVVRERRMPPWHADPRYGHFGNDRSLTPRDRATLLAWVDQGTPAGDLEHLPPPRAFPDGWSIGTPDVVFAVPGTNEVPAVGVLDYLVTVVPTGFTRDTWVQAAEIRPEARSVVHHIIVQVLPEGGGPKTMGEHLATYVPGDAPTRYPAGVAKLIPAGSRLKFGVHYVPDGVARRDRPAIGLVLAREPVAQRAFTRSVESTTFAIPPHAAAHEVAASYTAEAPLHLLSFAPHMHLRGKDFRYTATFPDGRSEVLLAVPAYDFGWQSSYLLAEPRAIPRGTRIDCVAHFDNSAANPANPDPSRTVPWGEQSFDEMMIGYFDYTRDVPAGPHP